MRRFWRRRNHNKNTTRVIFISLKYVKLQSRKNSSLSQYQMPLLLWAEIFLLQFFLLVYLFSYSFQVCVYIITVAM